MDPWGYRGHQAYCEGVPLSRIAEQTGTPCYVYSRAALRDSCLSLKEAFRSHPTLLCYAVKANGNLSVMKEILSRGCGADVVSLGELERALVAGAKAGETVFSGVGKSREEMVRGLEAHILAFNVESLDELDRIAAEAEARRMTAPLCVRVNPNIDAKTNPYIATGLHTTKFGIAETDLAETLDRIRRRPSLRLLGLACHIGSQITELGPFAETAARMARLCTDVRAKGFPLEMVNLGGGLGIRYDDETPPTAEAYARTLLGPLAPTGLRLILEPGRWLVGNAGVLLTRVIGSKRTPAKRFLIVDGAMNDLVRPALYEAFHRIRPAREGAWSEEKGDIVGPICESGDFLARDRRLPAASPGDLLVVDSCGAYGSSMASQYNCRPRAPEVLVDGDDFRVVRPRETIESLWASELEL